MEERSWAPFIFLFSAAFLLLLCPFSGAHLAPAERRILLQVQQLLEYPPTLESWSTWTDFCSLPSIPSLTLVCSGNHLVELSIVGNRSSPTGIPGLSASNFAVSEHTLSERFSLDAFLTVLTKLWGLQRLSLVSLGIWGPLPWKINRFKSLQVLNMSSNFIYGEIPKSVSTYPRLRSLVLSDNLFNGTVPDLSSLTQLLELDLGNNSLGPEFPSLPNSLVSVSLGNNSLRSEIPQDFDDFNDLQALDVSSNKLLGRIPPSLFSLPSIQNINLAGNQLSGALDSSVSCNVNLTYVDISDNLLVGKLPSCLETDGGNRTVISLWNCLSNSTSEFQKSYAFCQKEAMAVRPPERSQKRQAAVKLGIVLGIIGGILVAFVLLGLLIVALVKTHLSRGRRHDQKFGNYVIEKKLTPSSLFGRHVPRRTTSASLPPYYFFTIAEMEEATNSFDASNLLQEGPQGQVFKGWLGNGSPVLVKCLKLKQKHSSQALHQHMEVISKLRHRHLVSVLGHCIDPNTATAVYIVLEYVANGSLRDHLTDWRKREFLKWPQRMGIIMGVARGLQYLHSGRILGNDLKLDSILLDETLNAKISSYNISLPATVGAESPLRRQETSNPLQNPEKEDIYQLGVVLIEVITGRPTGSQNEIEDLNYQLERSFSESPSNLRDIIDPSMRGTFAYESLKTVAQMAINCLSRDPCARPTVEDVLWHLQYSLQIQEGWGSSGNLSGSFSMM